MWCLLPWIGQNGSELQVCPFSASRIIIIIIFAGYWFLDDADVSAKKWTPPESLVTFIDNAKKLGRKLVYIGFGSIVVPDPKAMTHSVIQAVLRSGVHAILSKGWSDRLQMKSGEAAEPEEPYPPEIYPISSIPHDWLFQRIDAACHHGGAGTTGASLRGRSIFNVPILNAVA